MSEYQYYEFAAIDGPISDKGFQYARGCSSRATVSRVRWQNTYTFGDFHGSVDRLLKYYDAHFYVANWGTIRLCLALPKGVTTPKTIQPYLRGDDPYDNTLTFREVGDRYIVCWERNEEDGCEWIDGKGIIDQLVGIREELMRGDFRSLFLGWLGEFDPEELRSPDDDAPVMPPIPAGLDRLSAALEALIEHLPVDPDALAVAAAVSQTSKLDRIPVPEMRALLERVAEGRASVMTELNRLTHPKVQTPLRHALTWTEFAANTIANRKT